MKAVGSDRLLRRQPTQSTFCSHIRGTGLIPATLDTAALRQECRQRQQEAGLIVGKGHRFFSKLSEQDLCIFNENVNTVQ